MEGGSIFGEKASRQAAAAFKALGLANKSSHRAGDPLLPPSMQAASAMCPLSVSLEELDRKARQLERKGWGKKQAEDREAKKIISDWLGTRSCIKAGLILSYFEAALRSPGNSPKEGWEDPRCT